jgi:Holliday junction resolvase
MNRERNKVKLGKYTTAKRISKDQCPVCPKKIVIKEVKKRISKNTAYKRGRAFEYRVRNHFRKLGYYVIRMYASKGAADLIAIQKYWTLVNGFSVSEVLLIQCKNLKVEKKLSKKESDNLIKLSKLTGGKPLLVQNIKHKLVITEISQ